MVFWHRKAWQGAFHGILSVLALCCLLLSSAPTMAGQISPHDSSVGRPLVGVGWMVIVGICFVGVTAVVKLVADAVPASQAAFLRYALGLVFFLPAIPALMRLRLSRRAWGIFGLRAVVHSIAVSLWFFAMMQISIAEVTAMYYLVPIFIAVGAAFFLGERLAARRVLAIAAALLGALVILRPGFREVMPGHIAMLVSGPLFAASYLIAKRMSAEVSPALIVALMSVGVSIGLAPAAYIVWVPPTAEQLAWLFLAAALATAAHYAMTLAFAAAPITVTQPVTFLQLLWATLVGMMFFAEPADLWVLLGGTIIIASVCFIAWREAVARRGAMASRPDTAKSLENT